MTLRNAPWHVLCFVVAMLIVTTAVPAFADAVKCTDYAGLTNKVVSCIRATLDNGVTKYFDDFYPLVQTAITAVMTLAVVVYGIMMAYGMVEKIGRDTMILLFKIAGVVYFSANSQVIYDMAMTSMDDVASAIISYAPESGTADNVGSDFSRSICLQTMIEEQTNKTGTYAVGPWLGMDCLIDSVIGIKMPESTTSIANGTYFNKSIDLQNTGVSRGLIYLFFSGMQTSTVGILMMVLGGIFIWGLITLIIKTLFIYLAGYMGIAFMSIISPLFIPMILFQHTKQYFDKWVKSFFSFALQPIIMMAFITFTIASVDFAAFSGDYSIWYRIAGEQTRSGSFDLNTYLTKPRDANGNVAASGHSIIEEMKKPIVNVKGNNPTKDPSPITTTDEGGVARNQAYTKCTDIEIAKDKTGALKLFCSFKYGITFSINKLDWTMMAKARTNPPVAGNSDAERGQNIAKEVLSSVAFCAMVIYLMNGFLKLVPMIAYDITGDYNQSAGLGKLFGGGSQEGSVLGKLAAPIQDKFRGRR